MGRTVPTFTMVIHEQESQWKKFREALRKEDQEIFDDLFRAPRIHLAACAYAVNPIPFENIVMSMLVEERKKTVALEKRLEGLIEYMKDLNKNEGRTEDGHGTENQGMVI
ncbi:MAG: hypothetical protein M1378_11575 [Bacteroidetes bacterium]|nr:hypothetical protein [Bacteroidota bacterium]